MIFYLLKFIVKQENNKIIYYWDIIDNSFKNLNIIHTQII